MGKYKNMTPTEYGEAIGLKLNAITKALRENRQLSGVEKVSKFGRFYLLKVNTKNIVRKKP